MADVAYNRIIATIKAAGDAAGDLLRVVLGTAGAVIPFPALTLEDQSISQPTDTGQMWTESDAIPTIINKVGFEMDRSACLWVRVSTGGAGVAPTIIAGHAGVATAVKSEIDGSLGITFNPSYANANYYVGGLLDNQAPAIVVAVSRAVDALSYLFYDIDGVSYGVNSLDCTIFTCGQM